MGIKATCPCGAQFTAKPELAGRSVKCPTCGQSFQVPKTGATAPAPKTAAYQVACSCGRTYAVQPAMAGKPVRCNSCGQQFVVPHPRATTAAAQVAAPPAPDLFAGAGPLDNLGDISSYGDPFAGPMPGSAFPAASYPAASFPAASFGAPGGYAHPKPKRQFLSTKLIVSVVLGTLVVLAIAGIGVATFLFLPLNFGSGYRTPEAVWTAHRDAAERKDWKTLFNTLTPDGRNRAVGILAYGAQMMSLTDGNAKTIVEKHGLPAATPPNASLPVGFAQMFSQMQQQMETAGNAIQDKEAFFVEVLNFFTEKGEAMRQQMEIVNAPQQLKDVLIEGDTARATQSVTFQGTTVDRPVEFRRIDGGWLIHLPSVQEMSTPAQ